MSPSTVGPNALSLWQALIEVKLSKRHVVHPIWSASSVHRCRHSQQHVVQRLAARVAHAVAAMALSTLHVTLNSGWRPTPCASLRLGGVVSSHWCARLRAELRARGCPRPCLRLLRCCDDLNGRHICLLWGCGHHDTNDVGTEGQRRVRVRR